MMHWHVEIGPGISRCAAGGKRGRRILNDLATGIRAAVQDPGPPGNALARLAALPSPRCGYDTLAEAVVGAGALRPYYPAACAVSGPCPNLERFEG